MLREDVGSHSMIDSRNAEVAGCGSTDKLVLGTSADSLAEN